MSINRVFVWLVAAASVLLIAFALFMVIWSPRYSVVSTASGFYVGNVSMIPFSDFIVLKNAYLLDNVRNEDNQIVNQQLTAIRDNSLWGSGKIELNKNQVLFISTVEKCSPIDQTLNKDNDCPKPQPAPQPAPQPSPAPVPAK